MEADVQSLKKVTQIITWNMLKRVIYSFVCVCVLELEALYKQASEILLSYIYINLYFYINYLYL